MTRISSGKRLLAILLSVAMIFAFMPMLGAVNKANAKGVSELQFVKSDDTEPYHFLVVHEDKRVDWDRFEPDFDDGDSFDYLGTKYKYGYYYDGEDSGWFFLDEDGEPIEWSGYYYVIDKKAENGIYSFRLQLFDDDNNALLAQTKWFDLEIEYDWDVSGAVDGDVEEMYPDYQRFEDFDYGTEHTLKVIPVFVSGFEKGKFRYQWSKGECSDNDRYAENSMANIVNATTDTLKIDTNNLKKGTQYRFVCAIEYGKAVNEYSFEVEFYIYIRTDDETAGWRIIKMLRDLEHTNWTLADEAKVKAIRAAYEALTPKQKEAAQNWNDFGLLEEYEKRIAALKAKKTPGPEAKEEKSNPSSGQKTEQQAKINAAKKVSVAPKAKGLKNRRAQLSWKKKAGVSGYEVWQGAKKKGKYKKAASLKAKKTKWKSKKIKKGKKAFFKMRTFTMVNGKKVYGKWSKVIAVKLKK